MRSTIPPPDDEVETGGSRSLVVVLSEVATDTPEHQRFRKLIDKIERKRAEIKEWEEYKHRYSQRVAREIAPLQSQLHARQRQMALFIGDILSRRSNDPRLHLKRLDRSNLRDLLSNLLDVLQDDGSDEELADLRARHAPAPPDKDELDEEGRSEETLDKMREAAARASARQSGRSHKDDAAGQDPTAHGRAGKPASPSLREVYRRLVSILHPDREPDPAERERKNQLMQRVNKAYASNDLLTLLALQVELELTDVSQLTRPEHIAGYNDVLRAQLSGLEDQLRAMRSFYLRIMVRRTGTLSIRSVERQLTMDIKSLQLTLKDLTRDLEDFRDPIQLRAFLDQLAQEQEEMAMAMERLKPAMEPPRRQKDHGGGRRRKQR